MIFYFKTVLKTNFLWFILTIIFMCVECFEANAQIYVDLSSQGGGVYGFKEEEHNGGETDYEVMPVKVYNTNGQLISIAENRIKARLYAVVRALDEIKNENYGYYEINKSLGVQAGALSDADVLETIAIDALGFLDVKAFAVHIKTAGVSAIFNAVGLISDTVTEAGSLSLALNQAALSLSMQKLFIDAAKYFVNNGEQNSYITYESVKYAYYLLKASDVFGDIAYGTFKLTIESAGLDSVEVGIDLLQSQIPVIGPLWSGFMEGLEAGDLLGAMTWHLIWSAKDLLTLAQDTEFELMERETSFPENFYFYEPNGLNDFDVNNPPSATFIFNAVNVLINETVYVDATPASDPDGDELSYYWTLVGPTGSHTAFQDNTAIQTNFIPDVAGAYLVKLTLYDGKDFSSIEGGVVANKETSALIPVAEIIPSKFSVELNTQITLNGSSSYCPDGDSIVNGFSWTLVKPDNSFTQLSSTTGQTVSFTPDQEGSYTAMLVVTDENGQSSQPSSVTVKATDVYPNVVQVYEDDGDLHIYIEKITFSSTDCQYKYIKTFTVPPGEKWTEIDFWGSQGDIVLLVDDDETPTVDNSDPMHSCSEGYVQDFDSDVEYDWYDGTAKFTWTKDLNPGAKLRIAAFSYGGSVSGFSINTMVTVTTDLDNDGVPDHEEDSACLNNSGESFDSDGDGYCDNTDKFDNDPSAYLDSDGDGYPNSWITGKTQADSTTGLTLDRFTNDPTEWADSDNDGIGDNADKFDNDVAASVDSDDDGYPDAWNAGKSESDSTTGLSLDKFPTDPAAAVDSDNDGHPDRWNPGKTSSDSITSLTLDFFPSLETEWADSDHDGVGDNSDWAPNDYHEWSDSDGDDVGDNADAAPYDFNRQTNEAPVIETIANQSMDAGSSLTLPVSVFDTDGDVVTLVIVSSPSFVQLTNAQLSIGPSASDTGTYQILIKANDEFGGRDLVSFDLEVNSSVTANAGDDQAVNENSEVTLDASASSASGGKQIVSYLWEQTSGTGVTMDNAHASVATFTAPDVDKNGDTLTFKLTVVDNDGETYTDTCSIEILWVNITPVSNAGGDQIVDEREVVTLNGTNSTGVDDEIVSWQWTQVSGSFVEIVNATMSTATFTAPDVNEDGETLEFDLTVTDSGGLTASSHCMVQLTWVNIPPVADAGSNQTVTEGTNVLLNGSNSTDTDGSITSWLWEIIGRPEIVIINANTSIAQFTSPDVLSGGEALECRLTVTDSGGLRDTDTSFVNVAWINEAPHANAGPVQNVVQGDNVVLRGSNSTDSDDGIAHYLWSQISGTAVTLSDVTSQNPSFIAPETNDDGLALTFELKVTDIGGLEDTATCIVNVFGENNPPVAHAGNDVSVMEGTEVELDGSQSSDPDDGIAMYRWSQESGIAVTLDDPTAIKPRFTAPNVGPEGASLEFTLTVTDGGGNQHADSCIVNITWQNDTPVANAGPDQDVLESQTVVLTGEASTDSDDGIDIHSWKQTAGPAVTLSNPQAINLTFVAPPVTVTVTLSFVLTVEDHGGLKGTDQVDITVSDNGISGYADDEYTVRTLTDKSIAVSSDNESNIVVLKSIDPDSDIPPSSIQTENLIYGLIDLTIKVTSHGDQATVTVRFPEPVPSDYSWIKYSDKKGWIDYKDNAVFSANRDSVTLTFVDGGIGDDDGEANGTIHDPSGIGTLTSGLGSANGNNEESGGGSCFINSIF